jgi:hypothetical protein
MPVGTKRPASGEKQLTDGQFNETSKNDEETPLFERLQRIADAAAASGSERNELEMAEPAFAKDGSLTADSLVVLLSQALEAHDNVCLSALKMSYLCSLR